MKKLLSTLLALTMLIACAMPAYAAGDDDGGDGGARDTNFFTPQPHTTENFADIEYEHVDPAPLNEEAAALLELAKDPANAAEFETRFEAFKDGVYYMYAMWEVLSIRKDIDTTDTETAEEYTKVYSELIDMFDVFNALVRDVLRLENACSEVLSSKLTPEDIEDYLGYVEMTDEEKELDMLNEELELEYETVAHTNYTTTIDGEEYDADGVYDAFMTDGVITLEQYLQGCRECYGPYGELYLKMIDVRNKIAKLKGYDNYADYAYAEVYNRDYTVEEIDEFRTAVKKYLAPQLKQYRDMRPGIDTDDLPLDDSAYSGEGMFDVILPLFSQMSDELLESAKRVHDQGFYDISATEKKADRGYSMMMPHFNMPFYYNYPYGNMQDLLTTIHELGHNNKSYWSPNDWTDTSPSSNKDLAEVHSQGLELLMTHYYDILFGNQKEEVQAYEAYSMLQSGIISGCLHDEIQCYAYSTPNVTFEMICQKYRQLAEEYGNVGADDPRPEMYGWTSVHHTFNSPMYYISYATSAAGAFMIWEEAQEDFFEAVDHYLAFCAVPATVGFEETFEAVGLESPLTEAYVQKLAQTMHDKLFYVNPYTDVYTDTWYASGVYYMEYFGLIDGTSETAFSPAATATRSDVLTAIARLAVLYGAAESEELFTPEQAAAWAVENGLSDGQNLAEPMTREEMAILVWNFGKMLGDDGVGEGDLSAYTDIAGLSEDTLNALSWAVGNAIFGGSEDLDGNLVLTPEGSVTRAQAAAIIYRFILY
jgi:oligoendopeptidase F